MTKVFNKIKSRENVILYIFAVFVIINMFGFQFSLANTNYIFKNFLKISRYCVYLIFAIDAGIDILTKKRKINLLFIVVSICSILTFIFSKNTAIIVTLLIIYEMAKYGFKRTLNVAYWSLLLSYVFVIVFSVFDYFPNWIFYRGETPRYSLGFNYPAVTFTIFTFILLMRYYLKNFKVGLNENIMNFLLTVCIYKFTDSRTSLILCLLIIILSIIVNYIPLKKLKCDKLIANKFVKIFLLTIPVLLLIAWVLITISFENGLTIGYKLDQFFNQRISFTAQAFKEQRFTLFGKDIDWNGWGEYAYLEDKSNFVYNYLDNSYMSIMFNLGIVTLLIVIAMYTYFIWHAIKNKDYAFLTIIIIILVNSMIETNLIDISSNWFILYAGNLFIENKKNVVKNDVGEVKMNTNIETKSNKSVVAVVVTYNRKSLLKESIIALMEQRYKNLKVLVVDNNSTDGTKEYISDLVDNIKVFYINTGKNLGGSGGFNYGIKQAMKMSCDYIWIMDDDCIVKENSLQELLNFAQRVNDDFGYLSSYVEWKDGTPCKMNVQRSGLRNSIIDFNTNGQEIQLASFVSLFIRPCIVEDVGLPIKDFFIWGDDWEYTYRIAKKYKCYFVANSIVTHKSTMNIGSDISKDDYEKIQRYFYAYRNERYFYRHAGFKGKFYHTLKIMLHIFRIIFSKIDHKLIRLKTMFKGLKAGKKFNPEIEYIYSENAKIKVLEFFGEPLSYGGQEAFMLNMYKNFDDDRIHYTFATPFHCDNKNLIELAKEKGDNIIHLDKDFESNKRKQYIVECAKEILSKNKYDVIHIQSGSIFTLLNVAKIAKKYNIKKIIVHSHCTGLNNLKYKIIKAYSDLFIRKYVDVYIGCSDLAARWKFPKKVVDNNQCIILKNGIDLNKYCFKQDVRTEYRKMLNVADDEILFCNVGRFELQKNHTFLADIAKEYNAINPKFKFLLVGAGSLKHEITTKLTNYGIIDKFIFLENRSDVANLMMASDMFIMPSLFEGFPVTLIEAQATGLNCLSSNTITDEALISDLIEYLPIDNPTVWANKIEERKTLVFKRDKYANVVAENGFSAKDSANILERIYLS